MTYIKFFILLTAITVVSACSGPQTDRVMETNGYTGSNINKENVANTAVPYAEGDLKPVARPQKITDKMKERGGQDEATPTLTVESPKEGETISNSTVRVKVRVAGDVKMGKDASGDGNHVHVILDNQPYAAHYMWDEGFELRNVPDGEHTLRMFVSRPWHESYKNSAAFKVVKFTVRDGGADETKPTTDDRGTKLADAKKDMEGTTVEKTTAGAVDFSKPLLTYSRPKGDYKGADADPIMIDFWVSNAKLKGDGGEYRVRYSVNGGAPVFIEKWEPVWLEGWKPGKNTVKLELIDADGNLVENGGYNSTEREISVSR